MASLAPSSPSLPDDEIDPELLALPAPPRHERRVTLGLLVATTLVALAMAAALARDALYAVSSPATPVELGDLRGLAPSSLPDVAGGAFVCAHGLLGVANAIRFERPFASGSFRLSPVVGRSDIWVEVRVPEGAEGGRYVPPSTFCGRLMPLGGDLRHRGLSSAVERATGKALDEDAFVLVDAEDPEEDRFAVALFALFTAFGAWNVVALGRLARRVRTS